jgi:hypothetical protein
VVSGLEEGDRLLLTDLTTRAAPGSASRAEPERSFGDVAGATKEGTRGPQ